VARESRAEVTKLLALSMLLANDGGMLFSADYSTVLIENSIWRSNRAPAATYKRLRDGGYELQVLDPGAVVVRLPDGGSCQ
jgi:hypothetical protein